LIYSVTTDILAEFENGENVTDLNARIEEVNVARDTDAPPIKTFYGFDLPEQPIEADFPMLYIQAAAFRAGASFQYRRETEVVLEIGCMLDSFGAEAWRIHAAVIGEAVARVLDDIRGHHDLGEYTEGGSYAFDLAGWGPPGASAPAWGGFIARATIIKSDILA